MQIFSFLFRCSREATPAAALQAERERNLAELRALLAEIAIAR